MKKKYFPILILVATIILGVGYASINNILLEITGDLTAKLTQSVVITDIEVYEKVSATNKSPIADETLIQDTIMLSSNPTEVSTTKLTYKIDVYNNTNYDMGYDSTIYDTGMSAEFYSNPNIVFEVKQLTSDNQIIDYPKTSKLPSKTGITLLLTFKYKDGVTPTEENNTLKFFVNLIYKKWYSVTYKNIENSTLPEGILENDTLTINLSNDIPVNLGVERTNKVSTDYTYTNDILTLNNVTGPVIVHDAYYNSYSDNELTGYAYTLNEAYSKVTTPTGEIKTMQNVVDNSTLTIASGKTINLNTNEKKITTSKVITVNTGGLLTINGNGTIENDTSLILSSSGTLNIDDNNTLINNLNPDTKTIYLLNDCEFNLNKATIQTNGQGIYLSSTYTGTYTINNGTIKLNSNTSDNSAYSRYATSLGGSANIDWISPKIICNYEIVHNNPNYCVLSRGDPQGTITNLNLSVIGASTDKKHFAIYMSGNKSIEMLGTTSIQNNISSGISVSSSSNSSLKIYNANIHTLDYAIINGANSHVYIENGTIYGETAPIYNLGNITLGVNDKIYNPTQITLKGINYGIVNKETGIINFNDGTIISKVNILNGTLDTPEGYTTANISTIIDNQTYNKMYLTPVN